MTPTSLTLDAINQVFRDVYAKIKPLQTGNIDLSQRRVINAHDSIDPFDYVTKNELNQLTKSVNEAINPTGGPLKNTGPIRVGPYADRGAAAVHANTFYLASDRDYIGFYSIATTWVYAFGIHRDTFASRPTPGADEVNYAFFATDTEQMFYWNGAAWVQEISPALLQFLGTSSSFPALKRSSAILQVRLADDSAYTALEVLDEAYSSGWNSKVEVPTKNAVYDKIQDMGVNANSGNTQVNGSIAGVAIFSQPMFGPTFKKVCILLAGLNGTASYTFPTAFSFTPQVLSQSLTATVTSLSTTAVTVTGAVTTGFVELSGF